MGTKIVKTKTPPKILVSESTRMVTGTHGLGASFLDIHPGNRLSP